MILATEMTKHFEHLAKFMNVCSSMGQDNEEVESIIISMRVEAANRISFSVSFSLFLFHVLILFNFSHHRYVS
jgi:hypothetical protein